MKQNRFNLDLTSHIPLATFVLLLILNLIIFIYPNYRVNVHNCLGNGAVEQHIISQIQNRECKRILWIMGMPWHENNYYILNFVKYAVTTQKLRAPSLLPMLMYKGPKSNPFVSWLQANGVIVCNIQNSLEQELLDNNITEWQQGYYYRMVINEYIQECLFSDQNENNIFNRELDLEYVLYTDTDVSFFQDIDSCNIHKPSVVAFGAEAVQDEGPLNTGVLVFNYKGYMKHQSAFFHYCRTQNWMSSTWDQVLYQDFFGGAGLVDELPNEWNWKPYWGRPQGKKDIRILHYHGPKPGMECLDCLLEKKIRRTSPTNRGCLNCLYVYELLFTWAADDNFVVYQNLVNEWRKFVYSDRPFYNTTSKQLEL
eukprot:TRINITY_DN24737_c1_g1_i8.p1 TRINITY_DN24737_c1_g1~~TRINITY_DN24737_c1_g1_i8.p1  ORF type:complete len:387 (-),score=25.69 TRINITY_DN24737_c1_g1_i8:412-1515(-)